MRPIIDVAAELGLNADDLLFHGPHVAKVRARGEPTGKIVLVTAINPTPAGEGKTTVSVGLTQGLRRRGVRAAAALREPSLGPIFGRKGGGTGGGRSRLEPSARINLHFTGDLHAVTSAHNLLAALVDNALHFGAALDPRRVTWRRVLDVNDRSLRRIVVGLGGPGSGVPREAQFDITAASEVMAVLCLASDLADLKRRLSSIVVGVDRDGAPVTAGRLGATGAMAALLCDALVPNLVQTTDGAPAFVHGGPFGNIAHGCSSIVATRAAAAVADVVVTEAGFGFDLGGQKFLDIKCRAAGLWPRAVVLVASARALRHHGGGALALDNLEAHAAALEAHGLRPVVAVNVFAGDAEEDLAAIERGCAERGLRSARFTGFADGGPGGEALADAVVAALGEAAPAPRFLYDLAVDPVEKVGAIAQKVYGADGVRFTDDAEADLKRVRAQGFGGLPVCMAKTHLSLSDDAERLGRPRGFTITVKQVRVAAGAGYLLALTGEIMTMPGLPEKPSALGIDVTDDGEITGVA